METQNLSPVPPNPPAPPAANIPSPVPPKKSHKKLIILLVALFCLPGVLLVLWLVASSFLFFLPNPGIMISALLERGADEQSAGRSDVLQASAAGGKAELIVPQAAFASKPKITIKKAAESIWPQGVVGGLFEISISEKDFKRGLIFKITLNEAPKKDFALGYWDTVKKEWEWLPTINLGNNVYQTVLTHASYVGGGTPDGFQFAFKDPENQSMYQEFEAEMSKIAVDDATGKAKQYNDASWERASQIAEELTNKVIQDYCPGKTPDALADFFTAWQMMQFFPYPDLALKIEKALTNDCEEETSEKYIIRQSNSYGCTFNMNLSGGFFQESAQSKTIVLSEGLHTDNAAVGEPAWRTDWRVYQYYTTDTDLDALIHKESRTIDSYYLLDIPMHNIKGKSTDLMLTTFSLTGIREGESFPIWAARAGNYQSSLAGPQQTAKALHISPDSNWHWSETYTPESTETIAPGIQMVGSGKLIQDNGQNGAVISFEPSEEGMAAYKEATKKVREMAQQYNLPAELKNLYDAEGNLKGLSCDKQEPLRIVLTSEWKPGDNTENPSSSNDQDGDGLPDLVPLTPEGNQNPATSNDQNGDGLPDVVPLTPQGDQNGDGIPDIIPLTP
ncbi:MAG: hypothetical protein WC650_02795 [Candidatus Doudnabacteria bacterium]